MLSVAKPMLVAAIKNLPTPQAFLPLISKPAHGQYVAGGRPARGNDFAVYDPKADKWTTLPDLPTARNHMAAAGIGDKFYVAGGRFGGGFRSEITSVLEVFDTMNKMWTAKRSMSEARSGLNGIAVEGWLPHFRRRASNGRLVRRIPPS